MYCLKCKRLFDGVYCPECGSLLVDIAKAPRGGLHLGDANAISGGIQYSETNNITNHNNIVYEAQKTESQLSAENEAAFFDSVLDCFLNGVFDAKKRAEFESSRIRLGLTEQKAEELINKARKSAFTLDARKEKASLVEQVLQEVREDIQADRINLLKDKAIQLEHICSSFPGDEQCFFYRVLYTAFYPERNVVHFLDAKADDYWLYFWASVSYLKLGCFADAAAIIPKLGSFDKNKGDAFVLSAIVKLYEARNHTGENGFLIERANRFLDQAAIEGIDNLLFPVWKSAQNIIDGSSDQQSYRFYCRTVFNGLSEGGKRIETKGVDAQEIKLPQMQGFNPLEAVKQMGIGCSSLQFPNPSDSFDK